MKIYFGLELDDRVYPFFSQLEQGVRYLGPQGLLSFFETHLGLLGHPTNTEYLRIEQYRQALKEDSKTVSDRFYSASFEADQLATATTLLLMRDELFLAGWDFSQSDHCPDRLQVLAQIENYFQQLRKQGARSLTAGYADRFAAVLQYLDTRQQPVEELVLNEPRKFLPLHFQRLVKKLEEQGVHVSQLASPSQEATTDLALFQQLFTSNNAGISQKLAGDGSLLIFRTDRETDAAAFLAQLFRHNPDFRPLCLVPEKNRALDNALIQEGLPSLGILSASLARPMLQILKLVPTFFWQPIDPFKILEFVSLGIKPLHDELANRIAQQMAQTPGMQGDSWYSMINRFFDELEEKAKRDATIDVQKVRYQYNFWFERTRYDSQGTVPTAEVIEVFDYLARWAFEQFDESEGRTSSLLVLSEQAKRVKDLLELLPETEQQLSNLELERIVRTIYEPSPVLFRPEEVGHLPCIHHSSAILASTKALLWWNFTRHEREHFFSRWYQEELRYLETLAINLQGPAADNKRLLWQRLRPLLFTQSQLLLILPNQVDGTLVYPHPLHDQLEATFENLDDIIIHLGQEEDLQKLSAYFKLPNFEPLQHRQLGTPKAFIELKHPEKLQVLDTATFTSLDNFLYYPYQWLFRYQLELRKSSILSIVKDTTLLGNLAHRCFERLLTDRPLENWGKEAVADWIERQMPRLLEKEGAVLLMYGREPERVAFINTLKYAAWSLIRLLHDNGWSVKATEQDLQGTFAEQAVRAKADLVVARGEEQAVVDLKWRGLTRRTNSIRNEEDLQLVMYANFIGGPEDWAHSSYFIIEKAQLITRNNEAFKNVVAVQKDADHREVNARIWEKMKATYRWRRQQIQAGKIEVRTEQTLAELELAYMDEWQGLLEMRDGDAPFDDYRTLINLVN